MLSILVVDDEKYILEIWVQIFEKLNLEILTSESVSEALEIIACNNIDILITDLRMPMEDGTILLEKIINRENKPTYQFVCSGYLDEDEIDLSQFQIVRTINKPFRVSEELEYFQKFTQAMQIPTTKHLKEN